MESIFYFIYSDLSCSTKYTARLLKTGDVSLCGMIQYNQYYIKVNVIKQTKQYCIPNLSDYIELNLVHFTTLIYRN